MKKILLHIILIAITMATLSGCGDSQAQKRWIGIWMLEKERHPGGEVYTYPAPDSFYVAKVFANDSVTYLCNVQFLDDAINIIPGTKFDYRCIDKGNNEYIYFEEDGRLPLKFLNDTTIMIQRLGVSYIMVRANGIVKENEAKIVDYLIHFDYKKLGRNNPLLISNKEKNLRKSNHALYYILAILFVVAIAIIVYCVRLRQHAKYLKERLQAITEEHELRPEKVAKALKEVEDDFFASDYYASIHERIAQGEHLTGKDWADMKRHLNQIYPNFTSRLLELVNMSEVELQVCLLIKMRVAPKEMSNVLNRSVSSISSIRSRLYQKVFNKKGGTSDWDSFVMSL